MTVETAEYDGVAGFGPSKSKQSLLNALLLNEPQKVVTVVVRSTTKKRGQDDGRLTVGKIDDTHCMNAWQYVKLSGERNWKVLVKRYAAKAIMTTHVCCLESCLGTPPYWEAVMKSDLIPEV